MDKFGDIDLFVKVVENNGFAAAARIAGLSPASVTIKINRLEDHYGVRLLNRTTRRISLTEEGSEFYSRCLRILSEVQEAEEQLVSGKDSFYGSLKISAPVDFGQQYIAPLVGEFAVRHPSLEIQLDLSDRVVNLIEEGFDLGIRSGVLKDNRMVARKLASNKRTLCASPNYLKKFGTPTVPNDLKQHRCLTTIRDSEALSHWHFRSYDKDTSVSVQPTLTSNNGWQLRQWALSDHGIVLKSYWDVKADIEAKKLIPLLEGYVQDFEINGLDGGADLNVVYSSRAYLPERIRQFINVLVAEFSDD